MDRRRFLRNVAGLAALVAVRNLAGDYIQAPESFKFEPQFLDPGGPYTVIKDQVFILDAPYVLDIPRTVITGCTFIARGSWEGHMMEITNPATGCIIAHCMFSDERDSAQRSAIGVAIETGFSAG